MKVNVTLQSQAEITERELAHAIFQVIENRYFAGDLPDDAGCDWVTDDQGNICIGWEPDWFITRDRRIAALVDAANVLLHGELLRFPKKGSQDDQAGD